MVELTTVIWSDRGQGAMTMVKVGLAYSRVTPCERATFNTPRKKQQRGNYDILLDVRLERGPLGYKSDALTTRATPTGHEVRWSQFAYMFPAYRLHILKCTQSCLL